MSEVFEIRGKEISIGDPAMGLARYPVTFATGTYAIKKGALRPFIKGRIKAAIKLNDPYLFVMDSSFEKDFETWFHRIGNECNYLIFTIIDQLPKLESDLKTKIAFYFESEITGKNHEGTYTLDLNKVATVGKARRGSTKRKKPK